MTLRSADLRVGIFIALTVTVSTLFVAFTAEKGAFLYKEVLHLDASGASTLALIVGIPAYFRVFMGASSDFFPIFGFHRRPYYALAWLLVAISTGSLALMTHYTWIAVVVDFMAITAGGALLLVIMDAVMVRAGNESGAIGTFQAIALGTPFVLGLTFFGPLSGYVTQNWSYAQCFGTAALCGLLGLSLTFLINERRVYESADDAESARERRRTERKEILRALRLALTPGFIVLLAYVFYLVLTPGTLIAQFYYSVDALHLSKQTIGNLTIPRSAGALLGVFAFGFAARRLPVRTLVWAALAGDSLGYLVGFGLRDLVTAYAFNFGYYFFAMIAELSLLTLAAKACPPRLEGAVYGLILGAQVLALAISNRLGSAVFDYFGPANKYTIEHGWYALLWVGFGFTVLAVAFIPFLPEWTRARTAIRPAATAPEVS